MLAETFIELHKRSGSGIVEDVMCAALASPKAHERHRACVRFAHLWNISGIQKDFCFSSSFCLLRTFALFRLCLILYILYLDLTPLTQCMMCTI